MLQSVRGITVIPAPRISVVIPHLNEPDDLRRCLAALDAQREADISYEVIVVDNGSKSLPSEICAAFKDTRLEQEAAPGPGPARSRGASLARGDIVAFIDADCLADKGWMRNIVTFMDQNPDIHVIAGDVQVSRQDPKAPTMFEIYEGIFSYLIPVYVARDHYAATGNMSVRRDIFTAVGPFGGIGMAEDREWGQRATGMGFSLAYVPQVRVSTSACKSFAELARRWDRAIAHDYADAMEQPLGQLKWIVRSFLVALSPPFEFPRIIKSGKAGTSREVWLAFSCLVRIRLYRAGRMITQATHGRARASLERWNRD